MVVEDAEMKPLEGIEVENRPLTHAERQRKDQMELAASWSSVRADVFMRKRVAAYLEQAALVVAFAPHPMTEDEFVSIARATFSDVTTDFRLDVDIEHRHRQRALDNSEWAIAAEEIPETQKKNPKQENEE